MENTSTRDAKNPAADGQPGQEYVPARSDIVRSPRIRKIQITAMLLLLCAAIINYLDRSSLSVANMTIREELGLNATEIGMLLSAFSLAYGLAQLPCGALLDRKGPVSYTHLRAHETS